MYKRYKETTDAGVITDVFVGMIILCDEWRLNNDDSATLLDIHYDDFVDIKNGYYPASISQDNTFRYASLLKLYMHTSKCLSEPMSGDEYQKALSSYLYYVQLCAKKISNFGIVALIDIMKHENIEF